MPVTTPVVQRTLELPPEAQAEVIVEAESKAAVAAEDLLAQIRWRGAIWLGGVLALVALDVATGWFYLASYFGYFHLPLEGLGITAQEVVAQGARSLLMPVAVIPVASVAAAARLRVSRSALAVGAYILMLTYVAFATSFFTIPELLIEIAAMFTTAGVLFFLRRGYGRLPTQRLVLLAATLLAFSSLPVAIGLFDASETASATHSGLRFTTQSPVLPGSVADAGAFSYSDYLLVRENETRYWVMRIGDNHVYSIAKSQVISIRYA